MCEEYLLLYHKTDILKILNEEDNVKHYSIYINFIELFENNPNLGNLVLKDPDIALEEWMTGITKVQCTLSKGEQMKLKKIHCRLHSLPVCPELVRSIFPSNEDTGKFLEVSGTVVRISAAKILEFERQYICTKCKCPISVKADYDQKNLIVPPKKCANPEGCKGTHFIHLGELDSEFCKDYQEIKIQEPVTKLGIGSIPSSMWVTLEDDLVDTCKPGDSVTICGTVKRRWEQLTLGKKSEIEIVFKANYVLVNNTYGSASVTPEIKAVFENFWDTYSREPLVGRDIILKSICPQLFGLYFVKLATVLVLAGGSYVEDVSLTGVRIRSESHLLLVGDPGTGKSQLLRFASKIMPRSVLTTGVGSTAAGLTVTAIKENGEWQLEGGALVMADGGICCIDEFNSMKEHDRTSIHEAMEQQTISVAKASIVCKLSTKCSILAACNPKGNFDPTQPLSLNIALASPLLSRFDLILLLRDTVNEEWDSLVSDYILNGGYNYSKLTEDSVWSLDLLQAYFKIIKKINPVLTEESNIILSNYYQCQRRIDNRNKSRTTVRLLDSLIRLSQAHAKLMFHSTVQVIDAVFAILLVDTAMENDARLLNLDLNTHSTFSEDPMGDYLAILEIILPKLQLQELLDKEKDELMPSIKRSKATKSRFFNKENSFSNEFNLNDIQALNVDQDDIITSTQIENIETENINEFKSETENVIKRGKESKDIINDPFANEANSSSRRFLKDGNKQKFKTGPKAGTSSEKSEKNILLEDSEGVNKSMKYRRKGITKNKTSKNEILSDEDENTCARKSKKSADNNMNTKKIKLDKKFDLNNDLQLLKCIPSVNDDILNLNLNFDDDYDISRSAMESSNVESKNKNVSIKNTSNCDITETITDFPMRSENETSTSELVSTVKKNRLKELFGFKPREKREDAPVILMKDKKDIQNDTANTHANTSQSLNLLSSLSNENIDDIDFEL